MLSLAILCKSLFLWLFWLNFAYADTMLTQCIIHCRQSFPFISIDTYVWVQQIALNSISSDQYTYLTFRRIFSRVRPQLQTRRNSKSTNKLRTIRDTAMLECAITQRLTCYVSLDPCVGHWTPQKIKP